MIFKLEKKGKVVKRKNKDLLLIFREVLGRLRNIRIKQRKEIARIKAKARTAMEVGTADVEVMILNTKGFDNIRSEPFS